MQINERNSSLDPLTGFSPRWDNAAARRTKRMAKLFIGWSLLVLSFFNSEAGAQVKMTVGQAGINPGTSLYFIAQKEKFFDKYGL
jgi:ABC-type nitrate/sulfonate/bicarbonate transport system substrate-binding protein